MPDWLVIKPTLRPVNCLKPFLSSVSIPLRTEPIAGFESFNPGFSLTVFSVMLVQEGNTVVANTMIVEMITIRIKAMTDSINQSLGLLTTEARNPLTHDLDNLSALELVKLINSEDEKVAAAVAAVSESIAKAIDKIANRLSAGGRLI